MGTAQLTPGEQLYAMFRAIEAERDDYRDRAKRYFELWDTAKFQLQDAKLEIDRLQSRKSQDNLEPVYAAKDAEE